MRAPSYREAVTTVSITIPAMRALVSGVEGAATSVRTTTSAMRATMGEVGVESSATRTADPVGAWLEAELPGLRRRLQMAVALENSSPTAFPGGVVSFQEELISTRTPAEAAADARAVAAALNGSSLELTDDLLTRLEEGMADPYFAAALARAVTPEQMGRVVLSAGAQRQALAQNLVDPTDERLTELDARFDRLLTALGAAVGTATRATGELAPPADYAQRWISVITADDQQDFTMSGVGASASLVLSRGVFSGEFYSTVLTGVYDFEQTLAHHGWQQRSTDESGGYTGPVAPGGQHAYDPLANLLLAGGRNAAVVQSFLTSGTTREIPQLVSSEGPGATSAGKKYPTEVNDRLAYLLLEREWPTDDGDGLGTALLAASTHLRGNDAQGRASATVAAQVVSIAGSAVGSGAHWLGDGWQVPKGVVDDVTAILVDYRYDIVLNAGKQNGQGNLYDNGLWTTSGYPQGYPAGLPTGMRVDSDALAALVQSIGRDDTGGEHVGALLGGISSTVPELIDAGFADYRASFPGAPKAMQDLDDHSEIAFGGAVQAASALAFVVLHGWKGGDAKEKLNAEQAAAASWALEQGLSFVPGVGNKAADWALDQGKSKVAAEVGESATGGAVGRGEAQAANLRAQLETATINGLLRNGYLVEDVPPIPAEVLVRDPRTGVVSLNPSVGPMGTGDDQAVGDAFERYARYMPPETGTVLADPFIHEFPVQLD